MANMSHCRFHNTLGDLRDCRDNWDEETGEDETLARARLLKVCQQLVSDYGEEESD